MAEQQTFAYNSDNNTAEISPDCEWQDFFGSKDDNLFKTSSSDGGVTVMATDGETMQLQRVTPEQIVILFAAIRALRDQAEE